MKTIYLDHAAGTPLRPEVREMMVPFLDAAYGNPSSLHERGRKSLHALTLARENVAHTLGVQHEEIIFTSSATEANNLAILGTVGSLPAGPHHILIGATEHASVLEAAERLARKGCEVEYIPVDAYGRIDPEILRSRLKDTTRLISVMYANNEIGTIAPLHKISEVLRETYGDKRPLFHTDACQAGGQLPLLPHALGIDLMTLNGSKMYGPRGVGMLYVRQGTSIEAQQVGGHQEFSRRAGTENLPAIVGFAHALLLAEQERSALVERLSTYRDLFIHEVTEKIPSAVLNGHPTERLPGNIHFSFPTIEGESLVLLLDMAGICASTGSACASHSLLPSHVLRAIGQSHELIHGSIRFTLGKDTTLDELETTRTSLIASVARLQSISSLTTSCL